MDYRGMMVGDWLLDKEEGFARRVAQVTSDVFGGCAPGVILENGMDYQECEPIPLTAEILEKNGFVPDNFSPYYLPIEDGSVRFSNHQYGLYCNILLPYQRYDGVCNYVHNLQHAMRLCGLNELADNFII